MKAGVVPLDHRRNTILQYVLTCDARVSGLPTKIRNRPFGTAGADRSEATTSSVGPVVAQATSYTVAGSASRSWS